ncbi:hypothetical protein [Endozoicomonas sp.]|uniref:hypothetical protein n=1 Tax=Endozoicomonas sp. TaxID=1892382 RepID=UPI00383B30F2
MLSPIMETELEIDTTGQDSITIAINTKGLDNNLQGQIPIKFILNQDNASFDSGEQEILWHRWFNYKYREANQPVNNDSTIYVRLEVNDDLSGKSINVRIKKEENISRFSSIAAFFPQMLPIILMSDVTWGPAPGLLYDSLMRWNYKILEGDIIRSIRELILTRSFGKNRPLLAQCSADFVESFLLFEAANYGETSGYNRGKIETFRAFIMSSPIKRLLDCMSSTVSVTLLDIQKNHTSNEWQYLKNMNKESINGLSKIMVGYGFNTFAFEAGDLFKSIKKTIGISNATDDLRLQSDLDRSLVKAVQYTLQSGYEDFFKGQLRYHGYSESYALPLATGAGGFEILWRLYSHQNMQGREKMHQLYSFTKRAEAMSVSFNQALALPEFSDLQLLMLGIAIPTLLNGALKVTAGAYSEPVSALFNTAYEGMVLGAATYLLSPVVQKYGIWVSREIQKPVLDYLNSESGSWSEYFLADEIRYRIDIFENNKQTSLTLRPSSN